MHHGIPAVLHRDEPWLHRHNENGALGGSQAIFVSVVKYAAFPLSCCPLRTPRWAIRPDRGIYLKF